MTDTEPESTAVAPNISILTQRCERLLEKCLDISLLMAREWAENKLADFRLWASGIGAGTADTGKMSLGARLSQKPNLLNIFAGLLRMLQHFIEECQILSLTLDGDELGQHLRWTVREFHHRGSNRVQRGRPSRKHLVPGRAASRSISPWSDQSSLDSDPAGLDHSGNGRLAQAMGSVESILDQLNNLGFAVRRTGHQLRLQKADSRFDASEHSALENFLTFRVLAQPSMNPSDTLKAFDDRDQLTSVQLRLINANLKRRNRFLYAQRHSRKLAEPYRVEQTPNSFPPARKDLSVTTAQKPPADDSAATKLEAATEALNANHLGQFSQISSTTSRIRYPHPPNISSDVKFFKCPCCCQTLDRVFSTGNRWRMHLAEDICPYTCIYDECPMPEATFATRQAWMDHLTGAEHLDNRCWRCLICTDGVRYGDSSHLSEHIQQSHSDSIAINQIPMVLEASTQILPATAPLSCPLCRPIHGAGTKTPRSNLKHIAEHIHDFALLSLPWAPDAPAGDPDAMSKARKKVASWLGLHENSMFRFGTTPLDHNSTIDEASLYFTREQYFAENRDIRTTSCTGSTDTDRDLKALDSTSLLEFPEGDLEHVDNLESNFSNPASLSVADSHQLRDTDPNAAEPASGEPQPYSASIDPTPDQEISDFNNRFSARPPAFYQPGRVFAIIWHTPADESQRNDMTSPRHMYLEGNVSFGQNWERIYASVRRLVVVKPVLDYCVCIPVNTYDGQGLSKFEHSLEDVDAHSNIYMDDTEPCWLPDEPRSTKMPIAVETAGPQEQLSPYSRLCYSQPLKVHYNIKAISIGQVTKESLPYVLQYFRKANTLNSP
ncbi:uncharacterized protein Z520_01466 [Fonsecaea multimorphosa CBS 102226]|uniref:C2H2-type domain-containing protein n=1 Tax=Fonsecaea multimorphosa CBS 102226 TaxID=1442371 RepID=A0A0D2KHT4_9EURO|nr:uncharacterized protein Z520_01466 [Fonsecaea multimorphosa CBS 102226]KIY03000.1 hypothetical protein Z520_01466 [Fonsecaea multimorphosa CBS 102226]OAL30830.1 hypothetical protein AYO22_01450 [Fonsecaea multimorphosa]